MHKDLGGTKRYGVAICQLTTRYTPAVDSYRVGRNQLADGGAALAWCDQAYDRRQVNAGQAQITAGHAADQKADLGNVVCDGPHRPGAHLKPHHRQRTRHGRGIWRSWRRRIDLSHAGNPGQLGGSIHWRRHAHAVRTAIGPDLAIFGKAYFTSTWSINFACAGWSGTFAPARNLNREK